MIQKLQNSILEHVYTVTNPGDGAITFNAYGSLGTKSWLGGYNQIVETVVGIGPIVLLPKQSTEISLKKMITDPLVAWETYAAKATTVNPQTGEIIDEQIIWDAVQVAGLEPF